MLDDLTNSEVQILRRLRATTDGRIEWISIPNMTDETRQAIDMLVLSGLLERKPHPRSDGFGPHYWFNEWKLTISGVEAADYRPQTSIFGS